MIFVYFHDKMSSGKKTLNCISRFTCNNSLKKNHLSVKKNKTIVLKNNLQYLYIIVAFHLKESL